MLKGCRNIISITSFYLAHGKRSGVSATIQKDDTKTQPDQWTLFKTLPNKVSSNITFIFFKKNFFTKFTTISLTE